MRVHAAPAGRLLRHGARSLAILPQAPQLSRGDLRREAALKRRIDLAERASQARLVALGSRPKFTGCKTTADVLDAYHGKRPILQPSDKAAAFYALGRLGCLPAHGGVAQLMEDARFAALRADLLEAVPRLRARQLSNVLQAAAYLQLRDPALLDAIGEHGSRRADSFGLRDVVACVYSFGRLRWRDERLLSPLLEMAERDVRGLHSIDLANLATGLVGLHTAPPALLHGIVDVSLAKLPEFGSLELPALLSCLASLGHSNERLVHAAAGRLPDIVGEMNGRGLAEFSAALAAAQLWLPPTLQALGSEAAIKATRFRPADAVAMLAAFGQLRWDQTAASEALAIRIAGSAHRLSAPQIGLALKALARLPRARDAAHGAAQRALMRTAARVPLPGAPAASDQAGDGAARPAGAIAAETADLVALATLCNAMQHLGEPPPPQVRAAAVAYALHAAEPPVGASHVQRRARAQIADASRAWGVS